MLTENEKKFLLKLARNAIMNSGHSELSDINFSNALKERRGVFVSLHADKHLRGCIGSLLATSPICQSVVENAINAAYHDYRFPPLAKEEMGSLKIEISLLTDPVLLGYIDATHLLEKLSTEEGIILKKGRRMATFLPQVWGQIEDKEEFLAHLCLKAGLSQYEWRDSNVEIYAYKVERFEG